MADTSLYPSITDPLEASAPDAMKLLQSLRSDYEAGRMPENVAERFVSLWNETSVEKQDTQGAIADLGVEVREVRQQLAGVEQELDTVVTNFTASDTNAANLEPLALEVREHVDATNDEIAVVEARTIDVREQVFDLEQHRVANIRDLLELRAEWDPDGAHANDVASAMAEVDQYAAHAAAFHESTEQAAPKHEPAEPDGS